MIDTDIPTELEAHLFCTTFGKFVWVCFQPFFYALRPIFTNPKTPQILEYVNSVVQITFDALVVYFLGKFHPFLNQKKNCMYSYNVLGTYELFCSKSQ